MVKRSRYNLFANYMSENIIGFIYIYLHKPLNQEVMSGQTLLKINLLGFLKSCLVIICPNSHEHLTKMKVGHVGVSSNIAQSHSSNPAPGSHLWSLLAPIHIQSAIR